MVGTFACADKRTVAGAAQANAEEPSAPAESLVTTAPGGAEIWFTLARPDSGPTGRCTDRAVEIRRGAQRIPVPLLYTNSAPELVNDTTFRARLSDHCAPGDRYLVDLRTGRPVREQ